MSDELASLTPLYNALPEFAPAPPARGRYSLDLNVRFLLCVLHDMTDTMLDTQRFPAKVAKLYTKSLSRNGEYGLPLPSCPPL